MYILYHIHSYTYYIYTLYVFTLLTWSLSGVAINIFCWSKSTEVSTNPCWTTSELDKFDCNSHGMLGWMPKWSNRRLFRCESQRSQNGFGFSLTLGHPSAERNITIFPWKSLGEHGCHSPCSIWRLFCHIWRGQFPTCLLHALTQFTTSQLAKVASMVPSLLQNRRQAGTSLYPAQNCLTPTTYRDHPWPKLLDQLPAGC